MIGTGYPEKPDCPNQIRLTAFFLEGQGGETLETHVEGCPNCRNRLAALAEDRRVFLTRYPFEKLWAGIGGDGRISWMARLRRWIAESRSLRAAVTVAGLATLMLFILWQAPEFPDIRSKGGVGLILYAAPAPGGEILLTKDGASLLPDAELQFVTSSREEPYLLLIGLEKDLTLSVYYPADGNTSGPVETGSKKKLPHAIRWRPHTPHERFYALFSKAPISLDEVRQAVDRLAGEGKTVEQTSKLPLPYSQVSIMVHRKPEK